MAGQKPLPVSVMIRRFQKQGHDIIMPLIPTPLPPHLNPDDRDVIITWARRLLSTRDFVILDTETTGCDRSDEVVQIGIIDAGGAVLMDTLVKPEKTRRMPKQAMEVHGISMKMLKKAPTFFELFPQILSSIGDRWVVCYNDEFDMRLLEQTAEKYDLGNRGCNLNLKSKCAMAAYSQFIGARRKYSDEYAWQRLPRHNEQDHKAIDDCHLTLDLIRELADCAKQTELINFNVEAASDQNQLNYSLPAPTIRL